MIRLKDIEPNMIANNLTPSSPVHPGEIINDEIEYRGLSKQKVAEQLDMDISELQEVLNGNRAISTEIALLFEAVLGIDHNSLLKMQLDYNVQVAMQNRSFMDRLAEIRKIAALW